MSQNISIIMWCKIFPICYKQKCVVLVYNCHKLKALYRMTNKMKALDYICLSTCHKTLRESILYI